MKKHDEGYTLPLVMVVLLILALVAATIMTGAMHNMQRQQSIIQEMQAQYQAQGEIEKIVAQLENLNAGTVKIPLTDFTLTDGGEENPDVLSGTISFKGGTEGIKVTIKCGIEISASEIVKDEAATDSYKITGDPTITYTSYEIIKGGGE